jgi:hypothetical protein
VSWQDAPVKKLEASGRAKACYTPVMNKLDRLVEARLALKARFEAEMSKTPSLADARPQGTGPHIRVSADERRRRATWERGR